MNEPYRCECGSTLFNEWDWRSDALYCANCRKPASRKEVYPEHTPGPWFVDMARNIGGWNGDVAVTRNGRIIAVAFVCRERDETLANANLIAAAPEMLEQLRAIRDELGSAEWANANHAEEILVSLIDRYYNKINKIIAKAEGRE